MRRRRSSNASSGMSSWNGRISVPVSTVAMPTSRSSVDSIGRGPSHYGDAANFVEAVALRRRGERSKDDTLRVPDASQCCSPHLYRPGRALPRKLDPSGCISRGYGSGDVAALEEPRVRREAEREVARRWREELAAHEPERMIAIVQNILPTGTRISNLKRSRQRSTASARASCAKS